MLLNGRVLGGNAKGHGVVLGDGTRIQVKSCHRTTYTGNSQLMKCETSACDHWMGISFGKDLSVEVAVSMASHDVASHGSKSRFTESQLKRLVGRR